MSPGLECVVGPYGVVRGSRVWVSVGRGRYVGGGQTAWRGIVCGFCGVVLSFENV